MKTSVFLDHNATTPFHPELHGHVTEWLKVWGNASSIYGSGRSAKRLLRESRNGLSKALGVSPLELILNSGGSESNNLAIKGWWYSQSRDPLKSKIITSNVEHPSVAEALGWLEKNEGAEVVRIPVCRESKWDYKGYLAALDQSVGFVSIMMAQNETGFLFPIEDIVKEAHKVGAVVHSDCVQALGKIPFDLKSINLDMASFSSHKVYALKGAGALYVKKGTEINSLITGGGQERQRRAGTENLLSLASFNWAVEKRLGEEPFSSVIRDNFENNIRKSIDGLRVTGESEKRLPNTSHLMIDGIDGESLLMALDLKGFEVSTGAACSSGRPEPSQILLNMGYSKKEAQSSLRLSFGRCTTQEHIDSFSKTLIELVERLRGLSQ